MNIEQDIARMAEQERRVRFDRFDQDTAWDLGVRLRELALAPHHAPGVVVPAESSRGETGSEILQEHALEDVELNEVAFAGLIAQKSSTFLANAHVWHNPRTSSPWESDAQIRKTLWEPLCKRAGVRYRNPYQVRHTYASTLLTAGTNPWYVAQQLGHVDVQMVFRVYGKFISQDYQRPKASLREAV